MADTKRKTGVRKKGAGAVSRSSGRRERGHRPSRRERRNRTLKSKPSQPGTSTRSRKPREASGRKEGAAARAAPAKGSKTTAGRKPVTGTRKVKVLGVDGKGGATITLPAVFDTPLRRDLIRKAVHVARANRRQPYGSAPRAGMRHSVATWGKGRGTARVQRIKDGRDGAESPNNVGGRRAHPPRAEADRSRSMNVRERRLARNSAVSATGDNGLVRARGHRIDEKLGLPLVVADELEAMERTKEVLTALEAMGLYEDLVRADEGRHIRAGRGKMRGRRFRVPRSVLIVVSGRVPILKSGSNLAGVDVVSVERLSTEDLAPGGDPGRLTVYTKSAVERMGAW